MILRGTAMVPGTCGELVQGTMSGANFLVSCPVNWFSRVTVAIHGDAARCGCGTPSAQSTRDDHPHHAMIRHSMKSDPAFIMKYYATLDQDERRTATRKDVSLSAGILFPAECIKTAQAVRRTLDREGFPGLEVVVDVASSLPIGKGMASSTADLSAACYAVAAALKRRISPEAVAEIALSIEPSDGTFSPGITLIDHVSGRLWERIGEPLPLGLLVLDFGGAVDTLEFNRRSDLADLNAANEPVIRRALDLVREGLQRRDPVRLGEGATMSALANQRILPKPNLEAIIDYALARGAYGVNVAHSGTVAGILLPPGREAEEPLIRGLRTRFAEIKGHYSLRLTGGGPRYPGRIRAGKESCSEQTPAWRKYCVGSSQVRH